MSKLIVLSKERINHGCGEIEHITRYEQGTLSRVTVNDGYGSQTSHYLVNGDCENPIYVTEDAHKARREAIARLKAEYETQETQETETQETETQETETQETETQETDNKVQHAIFREVVQGTEDRGGYTSRSERIGVKWSEIYDLWLQACEVDLTEYPHLEHKPVTEHVYGDVLMILISVNHITRRRFIVSFDHGASWTLRD